MSWFEDSNIKKSYIVQTVSDVGIFSACTQIYLTNILPCAGDTINITGNLGVSGNISGTTYYGDGSQLSGIVTTDNYVTGGVYSASTETLYFTGTTGFTPFSVDVSALLDDTNSYVTGGTYNPTTDTVTLTRNDDVNISITGISDTFTTGGTYNESTELITFIKNDGSSYTVDLAAIVSGTTNSYTTGATLNGNIIEFANSVLGLNYYNVDLTPIVSGKVETSLFNTYTADTQTTLNGKLDTTTFNTYSGSVETQLNNKTDNTDFTSHTGDTTIHFTKGSINLSELGSSAHTHPISEVINLQTELDSKVATTLFNTYTGDTETALNGKLDTTSFNTYSGSVQTELDAKVATTLFNTYTGDTETALGNKTENTNFTSHTGDTTIHYTKGSINLSDLGSSAHTHSISEITNLQTELDGKVATTLFNTYTGDTETALGNKVETALFNTYTGDTETALAGKLDTTTFNTYSGSVQTELDSKVESASNVGGANNVFSGKSGTDLQFRTISGGSNTTITTVGGVIKIDSTGGGSSTTPTLQEVLSSGNTTSGNDIIMSESDDVVFKYSGFNNRINTEPITTHRNINFPDNDGTVALVSDTTGYTETTLFNTYTGDTETTLNGKLDTTTFNTYSGSVETQLNNKTDNTDFTSHTGDTTIHFTKGSINLSDLGSSAHTHSISEVVNLQTELDSKTDLTLFNSHTGDTNNPHQTSFANLTSTAHTHSISDVISLQTELDTKLETTLFNTYTGDTETALDSKLATTIFNSYTGSVVDVFVSSGNANVATQQLSFTNTTGGTFNVTNSAALFSDNDINVTGGTYNPTTGCVTFTTNSGTTFDVCGFVTGITDTFVTGYTYSDNTFTLTRNQGLADLTSTINTMTGLTVNGVLSATTYTGITLDGIDDVTTGIPTTPDNSYQGRQLYFDVASNEWIATQEYGSTGTVTIWGKKGSAGTIDKGLPVYIVGFGDDIHEVELANATTATTMPVIGFTGEDFDNTTTNPIITFGKITGLDTTSTVSTLNPNGETWVVNDVLYMNTTDGGLTKNRPSGTNTQIQRIAKVLKVNASSGQLFIFNTSRTAGLPNLTTDYVWLGNGNDTPQEVIKTDLGVSVTGFSYDNNNTFTITDDNSGSYTATINQVSGLTVDGTLTLNSVGGTTSVTNLGVDSSGNVVSGDSLDNVALVGTYNNGYLTKWNSTTNTIENSAVYDNGTTVVIGTTIPSVASNFVVQASSSRWNAYFESNYTGADLNYGLYVENQGADTAPASYGIRANSSNNATKNVGIRGLATLTSALNSASEFKASDGGINYGVYSEAEYSLSGTSSVSATFFGAGVAETGSGTINAGYGLYLAANSGTINNSYGIYQEGASDKNYFGGQLQLNTVGAATPVTNLGIDASGNVVSGTTGGDVFKVGTPVNNQIGVWTGDGTIEGTTGFTWDGGLDITATAQKGIDLTYNPSNTGTAIGYNLDLTGNASSTNAYGFYSKVNTSLGGSAYGGWFRVLGSDASAFGSYNTVEGSVGGAAYGAYNLFSLGGTNTSGGSMYGSQNIITISTSGTHGASMIGSSVDLNYNKVGGSLTNAFGFYSTGIVCNDSGATITNAYGVYLGDNAGSGTINNSYGVYQAGADDDNYFAGSLTIDNTVKIESSSDQQLFLDKDNGNYIRYRTAGEVNRGYVGYASGGDFNIYNAENSGLNLYTNNTLSIEIDASANVTVPNGRIISTVDETYPIRIKNDRQNTAYSFSDSTGTSVRAAMGYGQVSSTDSFNIQNNENSPMRFYTNGIERVKIEAAGNVEVSGELIIGTVDSGTSVNNLAIDSTGKIIKASGNAIVDNFYYSISNSVDTRPVFEDDNVLFNWDESGNDLEFQMKVAPGGSGDMRSLGYDVSVGTHNTAITSTGVNYDIYPSGVSAGSRMEAFITAENDDTYPAYKVTVYNTGESFEVVVWIERITKI